MHFASTMHISGWFSWAPGLGEYRVRIRYAVRRLCALRSIRYYHHWHMHGHKTLSADFGLSLEVLSPVPLKLQCNGIKRRPPEEIHGKVTHRYKHVR